MHIAFLFEDTEEPVDGYPFLLHGVAVTDGDGIIFQRLMVDGDAERSTDGILTAVAFTDRVLLVILTVESYFNKFMISCAF